MRVFNIFKRESRPVGDAKYADLDKKVRQGSFEDRISAIKALEVDRESVNNTLLSRQAKLAVAISGAVIIDQDKSTITFSVKCDQCGYLSPEQRTSTIGYMSKLVSYFRCPQCSNGQNVVIEGPK